jgi:iron complex transport system substrate-binding protein
VKKSALLVTACILSLFVLAGCGQGKTRVSTKASDEKQSTQIVIDDLGRKIEIPKNPQRIICFRSDDVGTLFALGAGDKVVGRPSYEAFPEEAKKVPGVGVPGGPVPKPDVEKVLSLKPDFILMTTSLTLQGGQWSGQIKELLVKLENLNLKVIVFDTPKTLEKNIEKIKRIGQIVSKEKEADFLAGELEKRIKEIASKVKEANYKPKVATTFGDKFYVLDSEYAKFIEMTGGNYLFSDLKPGSYLSAEEVVKRNPEVIIVFYSPGEKPEREAGEAAVQSIKNIPGVKSTGACKNNRIYGIKWAMVVSPGPRIAQTVEEFAKCIHPEKF